MTKGAQAWIDAAAKRLVDVVASAALLVLLFPVFAVVAVAIKVESRGSVFFRCRRVGLGGCELQMLKFRKMYDGASGPPLTLSSDVRLTRVGRVLASTKLDELPQLWNVLKGEMSLVGPRPEDLALVESGGADQSMILKVKPGITGLSQLAFAKESEILDREDRISDYVNRLLPQKTALDRLYARRRSMRLDLGILAWTAVAVLFRRDVAVHRETGKLCARRRPREDEAKVLAPTLGSET